MNIKIVLIIQSENFSTWFQKYKDNEIVNYNYKVNIINIYAQLCTFSFLNNKCVLLFPLQKTNFNF